MESQKIDELSVRLDALTEEVNTISALMKEHSLRLDGSVERRLSALDVRLTAVERQLTALQQQLAKLIVKVAVLEQRLDGVIARLDKLEDNVAQLRLQFEWRFKRLELAMWVLAAAAAMQILLTAGLYLRL